MEGKFVINRDGSITLSADTFHAIDERIQLLEERIDLLNEQNCAMLKTLLKVRTYLHKRCRSSRFQKESPDNNGTGC